MCRLRVFGGWNALVGLNACTGVSDIDLRAHPAARLQMPESRGARTSPQDASAACRDGPDVGMLELQFVDQLRQPGPAFGNDVIHDKIGVASEFWRIRHDEQAFFGEVGCRDATWKIG